MPIDLPLSALIQEKAHKSTQAEKNKLKPTSQEKGEEKRQKSPV
jgi:hypothetical protein